MPPDESSGARDKNGFQTCKRRSTRFFRSAFICVHRRLFTRSASLTT
jgi:hypothetical protein